MDAAMDANMQDSHPPARNPREAWRYLCEHGGLELDGRDEGLDRKLAQRLDPRAQSLDEALESATMEAFATAFFEAIGPFVAMFRDILTFFETADATQGQHQWTLAVGDVDLGLDHFRRYVAAWSDLGTQQSATVTLQVPAIDQRGVWRLNQILYERPEVQREVQSSFRQDRALQLPGDVLAWVAAYNRGDYTELPPSLLPPQCPRELQLCAAIARAGLAPIVEHKLTRRSLMDLYRAGRDLQDPADGLDFWTIAQQETDYWLRTLVVSLSAAATLLPAADRKALGADLARMMNEYPLRPRSAQVSIRDLESVLSLPIWEKRYELYSVWIATEMIRALKGHEIELHHENGRIAFAFHETRLATIHSSPGPFLLISERRSPLANPRGENRSAAVQPDHALWNSENGREVCRLVAEVKHYKKAAKRKFVDVFEDYARAFPRAETYLVNYGPNGNAVYEVSRAVRSRCHSIERLTPSSLEARESFQKAVRACVGEPIALWPGFSDAEASAVALVLDVSLSVRAQLAKPEVAEFIRSLSRGVRPGKLVAVDDAVAGWWRPDQAGFEQLLQAGGGGTNLGPAIRQLLGEHPVVVLVTDAEGLEALAGLAAAEHGSQPQAPRGLFVRVLHAAPSLPNP